MKAMSRFAKFLLFLTTALFIYLFWSEAPGSMIHSLPLSIPTENNVKQATINSGPEVDKGEAKMTSRKSGSDQKRQQTLAWEVEQQRRKVAVKQSCRQWLPKAREYLPKSQDHMSSFLVDDRHKAIYCFLPKVVIRLKVNCTNWKRVWMILTGMSTKKDPLAINGSVPHLLTKKMLLVRQPYNGSVIQKKLESYTKLLVVRDPYERLLSAYKNKLEHSKKQWLKIINNIINHNKKHRMGTNTKITFSAFVNYLTDFPKHNMDVHWRPYHQLCYPCAVKYDVIAKFETLEEDSERFLRLIGAPNDLHFPPYVPSKIPSLLPQYMANLSQAQRHSLYQIYQRDFETFEYQPFGSSD